MLSPTEQELLEQVKAQEKQEASEKAIFHEKFRRIVVAIIASLICTVLFSILPILAHVSTSKPPPLFSFQCVTKNREVFQGQARQYAHEEDTWYFYYIVDKPFSQLSINAECVITRSK